MKFSLRRVNIFAALLSFFWYISLFPGRMGADYSGAIRMIQKGESTDWWSASYFWFLRFFSLGGRGIYLVSLIGLIVLVLALRWFISSLPFSENVRGVTFLALLATPIVGVFGVTVSHDVFQTSGLLLLTGYEFRVFFHQKISDKVFILIFLVSSLCLSTTKIGPVIFFAALILQFLRGKRYHAIWISMLTVIFLLTSGIGISSDFQKDAKFFPFFADLKCIAQHPQSRINSDEWEFLQNFSDRESWERQMSCEDTDNIINGMNFNFSHAKLNGNFLTNYIKIATRNPAITMMAHIQRSRGSLPPPFFQGMDNQVDLDVSKPIGQGTNIALQNGPELLHPSIDEPSMKIKISILKPLEFIAQIPTFIVNQASWFWGWGGFWLWPIGFFFYTSSRKAFSGNILIATYPLTLVHIAMFLIGPDSIGRYYMATIICGLSISVAMLVEKTRRP